MFANILALVYAQIPSTIPTFKLIKTSDAIHKQIIKKLVVV